MGWIKRNTCNCGKHAFDIRFHTPAGFHPERECLKLCAADSSSEPAISESMEIQRPFATVIVPTFNQEQYLREALDSLIGQTDPDWEAIVVNDGSTDRTAEIAEEYARMDPRVRCIHKLNGGVASALNTGLKSARGHWIHWLSSDDKFEPTKLEINRRWIERHPEGKFFFSYFTLLSDATGKSEKRELWGPLPDPEYQVLTLFYRNYVSGISICVNRKVWERVGFFDESLYYAQDYDQWLRLLSENQGIFIPEWTVISRNHAAQGSETFPDACYFDTAKAAIKFINAHSFPELVPWADLNDDASALAAIAKALDIACDRSSFLYCLGPHPALVLRVLEWVFSDENHGQDIKELVRSRIAEMAIRDGDDDWSWMWCQLALSLAGGAGKVCYSPVEPAELALQLHRSRQTRNDPSQQSIREYLKRFESIEVTPELSPEGGNARVVFFIRGRVENIPAFSDVADRLADLGYRPIILTSGHSVKTPSYEWRTRVPIIRVASFDHNTLPWLGEFELGITLPNEKVSVWAGARQQINWDESLSGTANLEQILISLGAGTLPSARPVIFLERVLWGGGAERVVYDIVRNLDRRRYRPVVLTMFDEHCMGPDLPADVEVINVRKESRDAAGGACVSCAKVEIKALAVIKRLVRGGRSFYHHLLSPDLRKRLGVGRRIVGLRALLSACKPGVSSLRASKVKISNQNQSSVNPTALDMDFINAMAQHNPAAHGLAKSIQRFGSDSLLVAVMEEASVTAWLAQATERLPYILSLHTYESLCLPTIYPTPSRCKAEKWLLSSACKDAMSVVLPSSGCANDLADNFDVYKEKIKTIWNPVDCTHIRRQSLRQIDEVSAWVKAEKKFRIVHVGRLDAQKNHELLLQACAELKRRGRDFSLAIVGGGQDRPWIEQQIQERGLQHHVFLAGEQKNPFPWMAAADVLLLTSRFEAFALVLVEAMVCGSAVISVDCPAGPVEVLANGKYGLLVPNDDCEAIATAVERVMDDNSLKESLVYGGYLRAEDFDVKNIIPQWEVLIDDVPR